jgi:hypothetical protein
MPSVYGEDGRRLPEFRSRIRDADHVEVDDLTPAGPVDDVDHAGGERFILVAGRDDLAGHHPGRFGGSVEEVQT